MALSEKCSIMYEYEECDAWYTSADINLTLTTKRLVSHIKSCGVWRKVLKKKKIRNFEDFFEFSFAAFLFVWKSQISQGNIFNLALSTKPCPDKIGDTHLKLCSLEEILEISRIFGIELCGFSIRVKITNLQRKYI